eukprot:s1150_g14.t1
MSLEPVQTNPSEVECKGSRGWMILRLPFYRKVAQHAQAAALGLEPYRPRVKLWFLQDRALNFAGVARVQVRCIFREVTLQTKSQALVFARPGFEFCGRCSSASAVHLQRGRDRQLP